MHLPNNALVSVLFCIVLLFLALPDTSAEEAPGLQLADFESIAAIVEREIDSGHIPGAVVLIGHQNRIVYRRAFGYRALRPQRFPMTEDTIFDLASLTKVIATTTAIMQLIEAEKLRLDDHISRYWPEFSVHGKAAITVRDLLTHYSGLRPDLPLKTPWSGYDTALQMMAKEKPLHPPHTTYIYSDINFAILGELVQRISGVSLAEYCATHIFTPLGMYDTYFLPLLEVRARIAPTESRHGELLQGEVHDPTASRMGGAAGHAGLFSTADDLARFAQMLLNGGSANNQQILKPQTVQQMTSPQSPPDKARMRGFGWDLETPFSSPGVYGHTGFTGTSLWVDPESRTSVIILTNRIHPHGRGEVKWLRTQVATTVAAALRPRPADAIWVHHASDSEERVVDYQHLVSRSPVTSGIDVLVAEQFAPLTGLRVGLITNHTGRDATGRRTIDILATAPQVKLVALFSPEHGLSGRVDDKVASTRDPVTHLPVYSLYGEVKRPTDDMLADLDALVFDIQDAGARFYTYITTMAYAMEAAARKGLAFYVLDRPNPLGGIVVQGPMLDHDLRSFTGYFPLPVRHGMTVGELAMMFNRENAIGARLHVITMKGYQRTAWYDDTGLPWIGPSPNLPSLTAATLYPGVALVEGANISVGRGTDIPFEVFGAPWMASRKLAAYLNARNIAGVRFLPRDFIPRASRYAQRLCHGIQVVLVDRHALDTPALGIEIASALSRFHPHTFELHKTLGLIGVRWVVQAIKNGESPSAITQRWQLALDEFRSRRSAHLLY